MNFWETKDWISAKTVVLKTEKILSRVEYLRLLGWKEYSEEKYQTLIF